MRQVNINNWASSSQTYSFICRENLLPGEAYFIQSYI